MSPKNIAPSPLEQALRHLAANTDAKVSLTAAKFKVSAGDIWDWLKAHNGGKREGLPAYRIDNVFAAAPVPAPKARKAAPAVAPAPAVVKALARVAVEDDGASPWTKHPRGPFAGSLAKIRSTLEQFARGELVALPRNANTARQFLWHWLGTMRPPAAKVARFLAWCDARPAKVVKTPMLRTFTRKAKTAVLPVAPIAPDRGLVAGRPLALDGILGRIEIIVRFIPAA